MARHIGTPKSTSPSPPPRAAYARRPRSAPNPPCAGLPERTRYPSRRIRTPLALVPLVGQSDTRKCGISGGESVHLTTPVVAPKTIKSDAQRASEQDRRPGKQRLLPLLLLLGSVHQTTTRRRRDNGARVESTGRFSYLLPPRPPSRQSVHQFRVQIRTGFA